MSDWVIRLIGETGYAGIFLLMMAETIFPPIPSEVIMPVAGVLAARGTLSLPGVIAAGTAGATAGNLVWYLVARLIGLRRFKRFIDRRGRWLTMDWYDVQRVEGMFGRFGWAVVLVGRLLPTIRSVVSIPAGLARMRFVRFLVWSTLGTAAWSSLLAIAGWVLGMQFDRIETVLGPLSSGIIGLIVIFYVWRQLTWNRRHRTRS